MLKALSEGEFTLFVNGMTGFSLNKAGRGATVTMDPVPPPASITLSGSLQTIRK